MWGISTSTETHTRQINCNNCGGTIPGSLFIKDRYSSPFLWWRALFFHIFLVDAQKIIDLSGRACVVGTRTNELFMDRGKGKRGLDTGKLGCSMDGQIKMYLL